MEYSFHCYGHENITARHKTTLEFTKDEELGLEGDCIIGVGADFSLDGVKEFIKSLGNNKNITITIKSINYEDKELNNGHFNGNIKDKKENKPIVEKISCEINPGFNSDREIVIRKGNFLSERTFGIKADKSAREIDGSLKKLLTRKNSIIKIIVQPALC